MTRAHFKFLAKQQLQGKVGVLFLSWLLVFAVSLAVGLFVGAAYLILEKSLGDTGAIIGIVLSVLIYLALIIIVAPALNLGRVMMIQRIAANPSEKVKATYVFRGFKHFWGAFKVQFFSGLFTFLWSLLFVIPAYIKIFSYSQAMYIYAENPDMGALAAINRSKMMMRGRKFDYFSLMFLSFYPWMLLAPFTLGILYVWLLPYMELTSINFYNYVKCVPGCPEYGFPTVGEIIPPQAFMPAFVDEYQQDLTSKEEPVTEESVVEEPVTEEPIAEEPIAEEPVAEEPVTEEPIAEEVAEPVAEEVAEPEAQDEDSEKQE